VTTIRASCPTCGDVQLRPSDVRVRVCADDNQGTYVFPCPLCAVPVTKDASSRIIELLVSSGVRMDVWRMPAELQEERTGPPITHDDLLDLHLLLRRDDWFEELTSVVANSDLDPAA
jgi:endogenous inhibitor of DNA gyrase (YacG/DUF329 family)